MSATPLPRSREFRRLVALCRRLGRDPHQAQAAGGNASMKLPGGRMAIKASGARLRELVKRRGWVVMRAAGIMPALRGLARAAPAGPARDRAYAELLGRASSAGGRRPSLEAGSHAAIPERFVLHLHSSAGIALSLSGRRRALAESRRAARGRWSTAWLPASVPGCELALALARQRPGARAPVALRLLQNHGVIWSGGDLGAIARAIAAFETHFRARFGIRRLTPIHARGARGCRLGALARPRAAGESELCACHWPPFAFSLSPLFPDLEVYFDLRGRAPDLRRGRGPTAVIHGGSPRARRDKAEVLFSHWAVSAALGALGRRPRPLPAAIARRVRSLEAERARLAQARELARA